MDDFLERLHKLKKWAIYYRVPLATLSSGVSVALIWHHLGAKRHDNIGAAEEDQVPYHPFFGHLFFTLDMIEQFCVLDTLSNHMNQRNGVPYSISLPSQYPMVHIVDPPTVDQIFHLEFESAGKTKRLNELGWVCGVFVMSCQNCVISMQNYVIIICYIASFFPLLRMIRLYRATRVLCAHTHCVAYAHHHTSYSIALSPQDCVI